MNTPTVEATKNATSDPTNESYQSLLFAYNFFNSELFDNALPKVLFTYQRKSKVMGYASSNRWLDVDGNFVDELAMNPEYFARFAMIEICNTLVHEMCHILQFHHGNASRKGYHNREWGDMMESIGLYPSSTGLPGGKKVGQKMSDYIIKDGPFIVACAKLKQQQFSIPFKDRFPVLKRHHNVYAFDNNAAYLIDSDYQTNGTAIVLATPAASIANPPLVGTDENPQVISDMDEEITQPLTPNTDYEGFNEALEQKLSSKPPPKQNKSSKTKYSCPTCKTNIWGKPELKISCMTCDEPFSSQA